jgi:hypothetical protein
VPFIVAILSLLFPALLTNCGYTRCLSHVGTEGDLPVTNLQCEDFRHKCIETAGCYKTPQQAEAELTALETKLLAEARPTIVVNSGEAAKSPLIEMKPAQKSIWNRMGTKD